MLGKYVKVSMDPITNQELAEVMNKDRNLLKVLCEGDLDWFDSPTLMEVIKFKWDSFGYSFHLFGCMSHLAYIASIFMYVEVVYLQQLAERHETSNHRILKGALKKLTKSGNSDSSEIMNNDVVNRGSLH